MPVRAVTFTGSEGGGMPSAEDAGNAVMGAVAEASVPSTANA